MILLDTHIWIWFVDESNQLTAHHKQVIEHHKSDGLGVSVISCWEVAKLVEYKRLKLACPIEEWMEVATNLPGVQLIELTPGIAITSTKLTGNFHRDPADQIIVATAQVYDLELMTIDDKLLKYEHVRTV
ncbi:MAG: twitching motility protein PilT [Candidatus Schekmanbacteria bacterium RBG_13_48_7]|uniref:Twitching motility protein PilT n=1 Tax=Candidatus Schekmanbacteria bacterium RBG_13_48_7 TaxID=1817878 RepID=A0A1F7S7Q7_9BACT|nr:MAG: twitching motility protein PilT [Candidatus Schekmanbacteria bacterium RBG_13_48_7]